MSKLTIRLRGGVMGRNGLVHREAAEQRRGASGYTVCGRSVENPISVTDNQIIGHKLDRCPKCYPSAVRWYIR